MNRFYYILIFTLAFGACSQPEQASNAQTISPDQFKNKLEATQEKQVLDVRTPQEYQSGALANAVNINFYDDNFADEVKALDKEKPVFVYCASGKRSGQAAALLEKAGFKQVYNLDGGIRAWTGKSYEIQVPEK